MLLLNKVLWDSDKILKCKSSDDWDAPDTQILVDCTLNEVAELLKSNNDKRAIFILDCNNGKIPTPFYLGKIFTFLKGFRSICYVFKSHNCLDYPLWIIIKQSK